MIHLIICDVLIVSFVQGVSSIAALIVHETQYFALLTNHVAIVHEGFLREVSCQTLPLPAD